MAAHLSRFPVRYDECDPYGHVNHAHYARYMGIAARAAADHIGYTSERLRQMGAVWLVREHEIEFIDPYTFGDTVAIQTWVADFRRVRSIRQYRLLKAGRVAARAWTDWVFADRQTGAPLVIPSKMRDDFLRINGPDEPSSFKRHRFPQPPPYAPDYAAGIVPVEWRDVDPNGHVNNAALFAYIENGTWNLCKRYGWPPRRMVERGFGIVARRYRIEYRAQAFMGDDLQINSWVSDPRRATAVRHYEIYRPADDTLIARARALWVWVTLETGAPIRIPKDFWEDFQANISESQGFKN